VKLWEQTYVDGLSCNGVFLKVGGCNNGDMYAVFEVVSVTPWSVVQIHEKDSTNGKGAFKTGIFSLTGLIG
jgi:hypothetical protein